MDLTRGVQEWTGEEYKEKQAALETAPRSVVSLTRGKLADEFIVSAPDHKTETDAFIYHTAALNSVLAWLNFPSKLRPFFDYVIALAGNTNESFTATNLEIGKQLRVGRKVKDEAITKDISRKKSQMLEWQNELNFDLIGIERGKFDPKKRKNDPTLYTPFVLEWIPNIVAMASEKPNWLKGRNLKLKEIRRAARDYLQSLPKAPPLRGYTPKTLSEEEKFDRRHHIILSSMIKNREMLARLDFAPEEYFRYLVGELDKIASNPSGASNLLTPEKDEVNLKESVWQKIKFGDLATAIEVQSAHLDQKLDDLERVGFNRVDYAVLTSENGLHRNEISTGHFASPPASDNLRNGKKEACKSLNLKTHDRTISGHIDGTTFDDEIDFSDWKTDAEETLETDSPDSLEKINETVKKWFAEIRKKVPAAQPSQLHWGVWQIYWQEVFDARAIAAQNALVEMTEAVAGGTKSFADLKPAVIEFVMSRLSYFKNGIPIPQEQPRLDEFRARLEGFLEKIAGDG